ncbi:MAG: HAMP domain-containing sensor histidine kinase [Methanoregula sp.]
MTGDQECGNAGQDQAGVPLSPQEEIANLKARIAFLENKLNLVGSVTRHDVLNQLTAIVGYNELLGMTSMDETQKSYLERERFASDKIRRQFRFAKDYQNIAAEPPRWQDLGGVIHAARESLDNPDIRVIDLTGKMRVFADPLLERALFHIFENTLRHGGTATEIRITLNDEGDHALLVIEDNGAGIPAADKDRIFGRGVGKGTGWGLFLVRDILAITGITIAETGEPGKGARFVLTLPAGTYQENGIVSSVL